MKRNVPVLILAAISATLILVYCSKKSNAQKAVPLDQLSSVKAIDPNAEYLTGNIEISTNASGDITVIVNPKSSNSRLFIIQGGNYNIHESIKNGEVIYLLHAIIINSLDQKERYYFAIEKPEEKLIYSQIPATWKLFFTQKANGYGVVRMTGRVPTDIKTFTQSGNTWSDLRQYRASLTKKEANTIVTDDPVGGIGTVSCDSGGAGAASCSTSIDPRFGSCSVSCSAGYYACCNHGGALDNESPTCKCIKNTQL
jgi:hypothetical protein